MIAYGRTGGGPPAGRPRGAPAKLRSRRSRPPLPVLRYRSRVWGVEGIPDVVGGGLRVLFCGINPGLMSAATGHHFARPGNRFWPALHLSGFTPRQLQPVEQQELLIYRLGITNVVDRPSAKAADLTRAEFVT